MEAEERFSDTYEILERLGEGSGGVVYKAYHKRLRQAVVLKKMKNKSISQSVNRQEVDILKNLHHSYLPQVLDFLEADGAVYTVMSYIPGKSFSELLNEGQKFTQKQLIRWGMQISSALNYLHSQKPPIIHGDIKPANIMLTPEGNICLIDFNIAFYLDDTTILGYTNGYTSPEQYIMVLSSKSSQTLPGHSKIDERTDIYSVGATFYHLVTGQKLSDCRQKIDKSLLIECIGDTFAQVIEKAVKINPEERYQSALEMFRAFESITKKDKRYRRLLAVQLGTRLGLVTLMACFIILGGYGIHQIRLERTAKYNELVKEQIELRNDRDYEQQEEVYHQASALIPEALESYYQNAYSLYQQERYEECSAFVDYDICENEKIDLTQARMADVYYLKADSCFRLEDYQTAVEAYEQVIRLGTKETKYYRDYAITLAYNGDPETAQDVLQEAIDYGLGEDSIYYAQGEIEKALGRLDAALAEFKECINHTDDNTLKTRAYLMMEEIHELEGNNVTQRTVLLEAKAVLPVENQMQILERLAQVDIDLADSSGDSQYRQEAIEVLTEILDQGWGTYDTYDTLAVLYEKEGKLESSAQIVDTMLERFGEDYNIYMRYAFLEIDAQERLENLSRDYTQFARYYEKALQLYNDQLQDNDQDSEMLLLEKVYAQVVEGGWLE